MNGTRRTHDFARDGAAVIAQFIAAALAERGTCSIALAGGNSPRPVYQALAGAALDWPRVSFFFGDERCVPLDDPQSNFRMAQETLLGRVAPSGTGVHRMEGERVDREAAARHYAALLPASLDVLLLGVGVDGHIASLFPRSPALDERDARVLAVTAPAEPRQRLTVTPPVIKSARNTIMLVAGAEKAPVIRRIMTEQPAPRELPAQIVPGGVWIMDEALSAALRDVGH